tara:strand:+ start:85 stop:672 length:588 start_codon:yes stop_codon:yes gene_type:complete
MKTETVKISKIKRNPNNPRLIKDDKFNKLVNSIKEFPEMLNIRPIVVNEQMIVLGGNMRLKACQEAGLKEIPVIKTSELTAEQQREFIVKDNVGYGEWDWDLIANEWDSIDLDNWGLDLPIFQDNLSNTDNYKGLNPELELDNFMNAEIKRLYLVYDSETFEKVIEWLNKKIKELGLQDYSQFILKLIEIEKDKS